MLPQAGRLRRRLEFQRAYAQGKRFVTPGFVLYVYKREDENPGRLGFVVGRRFGSLANRNRLKRRLRAAGRAIWERMKPGYDGVLVARDALPKSSVKELEQQVEAFFRREGLLSERDQGKLE